MTYRFVLTLLFSTLLSGPVHADSLEGTYPYRVTTVRAASGEFSNLLDALRRWRASGNIDAKLAPMIMRHSQGDQWDLMIVTPMPGIGDDLITGAAGSGSAIHPYFAETGLPGQLLAFEEDVFAYGPELATVRAAYDANGLFHIEMFKAAPGMVAKLTEQRRMENRYLVATGQVPNMIFRRAAGSDVDVFTIGFHKSLESFASPAPANDSAKEKAAKDAGFKDRADISFYLRSLISSHHDTLAVVVD